MIIVKYTFNEEEIVILGEGDIGMLTKFYSLVREYDKGEYIISKDHRPDMYVVEYVNIKGNKSGFVLSLTDDIIDSKDIHISKR